MISVALCTYNGEHFLGEQLQSLLIQSMPVDEVVIGDDGSTDSTLSIINSYKDRLPIRLLNTGQRLGAIRNFLRTIAECHGDIIFLSDQDDIWVPKKVETLYQYFIDHTQTEAVFTDAQLISVNGEPLNNGYTLWDYFFDDVARKRCEMGLMIEEFCTRAHATGATMAFRKSLKDRIPQNNNVWHDEMIARIAAASHTLSYLPDCLTHYRIHNNQQIGVSIFKPGKTLLRDYRMPEMPFSNEECFLVNEEDIRHIEFLRLRCHMKHQVFGWLNALIHIPTYRKAYKGKAIAFAFYDMHASIRHSCRRARNIFKQHSFPQTQNK